MNWTDRSMILLGVAAVVVTLGVGTCSTNGRFDDVNARIDDVNANVNARIDDVNANVNARFDDLHSDVREVRGLLIELLKQDRTDQ